MSRDGQRAIESFRTIASLMITNPTFRQLGSDVILLSRDIFADAASQAADAAKKAAEESRPSDAERKDGVDFQKLQNKGKATAKGLRSGKLQGEATESLWDEVEKAKQYFDDKVPEGNEAKDQFIQRLQQASPPHDVAHIRSSQLPKRTPSTAVRSLRSSTCSRNTPTRLKTRWKRRGPSRTSATRTKKSSRRDVISNLSWKRCPTSHLTM